MKRMLIAAAVVVVAAVIIWQIAGRGGAEATDRFEFAEVERGDIENVVSSSGPLSAVGTVEFGTQVSGTIAKILVDYNEPVRAGQVLAVLDTTMLSASVRDARGGLVRARALYEQAVRDFEREKDLHAGELISDAQFSDTRTAMETARAGVLSAEASLDRARANLRYAVIRSPIDGTVIMRNIEPGQTVAASFSTPTLFVIADDLSQMEIHALVDESDIGSIKEGQRVRFTVEAFIDEVFEGVVRQVWLQPQTISNVVMYTVVVDAVNDHGLLYPGMTATTDFLVDERTGVLMVPNTALRLKATPDMFAEMRATMEERVAEMPDSVRQAMEERMAGHGAHGGTGGPGGGMSGGAPGGMGGASMGGTRDDNSAMLWYLDEKGRLAAARITKGVTDGRMTEIARGRNIEEGMQVITAVNEIAEDDGPSNPLATGPFGRRRG
jgi:HlyD family secretion protein